MFVTPSDYKFDINLTSCKSPLGDTKKVVVWMVRWTNGGGESLGLDHNFLSKSYPFLHFLRFDPEAFKTQ